VVKETVGKEPVLLFLFLLLLSSSSDLSFSFLKVLGRGEEALELSLLVQGKLLL